MSGERVAFLPFLPGNSFSDRTVRHKYYNFLFIHTQKTKFHRSQTLDFKNGYSLRFRPIIGIGGEPIHHNQLTEADLDELSNLHPTLTYGNSAQQPAPVEFVPAHAAFDKKVIEK